MEQKMMVDAETLRELQKIEVEILKQTIDICDKLGITYYLLGGSLLGAVRHGGFIPWDDDIDIGIPRKDYDIFVKEAQKYYPDNIFVQHYTTEKKLPIFWCKVRKTDTAFMESAVRHIKMHKGVFVDIFPLDYYPESILQREYVNKKNELYNKAVVSMLAPPPKGIKQRLARIKKKMMMPFVSHRNVAKKKDKLYASTKSGTRITNYNGYYGAWGEKEVVPAEWYGAGEFLIFEGVKCRVPTEYHKWLTKIYDDYMQLPPEEERITHHFTDVIDTKHSFLVYDTKNKNKYSQK